MDSSMCSSAPDPEMWIIQGTLAWCTSPVRTGVWNQTSPQEDRWGDSGEIQCRSNFLFTRGIWAVRGDHHGSSLLDNPYIPYQYQELRDRPFHSGVTEGSYHSSLFFHAFPGGPEKAAINRIFLILPSRKEEREILFPFRRDQEIGSSRKKNAWLINNSLLGLRPPQSLRTPPISAMGCVYLSIS
ncbi:hypothetical protein V6N12_032171 [Hibiscus sabdariffa]|uniref:Uncharacterized protein n=1 Tax=Hibiscus sabdariffa TaxID=183260 RepID=A0ABR2CDK3_9ROSI